MATTVAERDANAVADVFNVMLAEGFFVSERHRDETMLELTTNHGFEHGFQSSEEHWFSNGIVDFKMVYNSSLGGYTFSNYRRLLSSTLDNIAEVFPPALFF